MVSAPANAPRSREMWLCNVARPRRGASPPQTRTTSRSAVIWAIIAGFSIGITLTLALSLFGLRTRHYVKAGALSGMAQAAGYTLAALGPIAIGAVHDATESWTPALAILVALVVVQMVFGALASGPKTIA
jgi:cyanate permease